MAVSDAQIAFVTDLFADVGPITTRKMFGGLGIYSEGTIFAVVLSEDGVWLKGAGDMAGVFEAEDWLRWTYARKHGGRTAMPYWKMPDALLDDPGAACDWACRALRSL